MASPPPTLPGFLPPFSQILPLIPLISSTATLANAFSEHIFLGAFVISSRNEPSTKPANNKNNHASILPSYFKTFFNRGVRFVISYGLVSVATGLYNYRNQLALSDGVKLILRDTDVVNPPFEIVAAGLTMRRKGLWYLAGSVMAAAHFAFVPLVMGPVKRIFEGEGQETVEELASWLSRARWRIVLADAVAWGCFVVAAAL